MRPTGSRSPCSLRVLHGTAGAVARMALCGAALGSQEEWKVQEGHLMQASLTARDGMRRLFGRVDVASVSAGAGRFRFGAAGLQAFSGTWLTSLRTDIGTQLKAGRRI